MKRWHFVSFFSVLLLFFVMWSEPHKHHEQRGPANLDNVPILGFFTQGTKALMTDIYGAGARILAIPKKAAIFTVGGLALDVYIRTKIPLDKKTESRILDKLHNYNYASRLTYFLMSLKDRYTMSNSIVLFDDYIKSQYTKDEEPGLIHSLFLWDKKKEEKEGEEDSGGGIDKKLIAQLVTVYDLIFSYDKSYLVNELPEHHTMLTNSEDDMKMVYDVLPIIVGLMQNFHKTMDPGDMKDMVGHIINDGKSENLKKANNKAVAATVTLIDFIRLTVLKNYRVHVKRFSRTAKLKAWMKSHVKREYDTIDDTELISYLKYANSQKKFGIQVVVDGLQGNLLEALSLNKLDVLQKIFADEQNSKNFKPKGFEVGSPEHQVQNTFLEKIASGKFNSDTRYLPYFKKMYTQYKNTIAKNGVATTPTISVRNLPISKTGANVSGDGGTSIPNFHFVDREKDRAYYFFGNDAVLLDELAAEKNMKSMFDRLGSYKTMNCNAQYDWNAKFTLEPLVNLGLGESIRDFGESLCVQELRRRARNEVKIRRLRSDLIAKLDHLTTMWPARRALAWGQKRKIKQLINKIATLEDHTLPDYLLVYNPWPDHFAHFKGPFSDEVISPTGELNRLDYWLAQIEDAYKEGEVLDRTLFAMAGDHGLAPIYYFLNPEVEVLEKMEKDLGRAIIVKKISSDEGEGPKLTNALDPPSNKNIDVIVASTAGGNYMMDFFIDQGSQWKVQPEYKHLVSWTPLSGGAPLDMIAEITKRLGATLEYLAVRDETSGEIKSTRIVGPLNGKRVDEIIKRHNGRIFYKGLEHDVLDDSLLKINTKNPYVLDYSREDEREHERLIAKCINGADENDSSSWCSMEEWSLLTRSTPKPDSVSQLSYLYESDRAGTVNLFPAKGIGYNTKVPGRHAGESFHEKDAFVGFWGVPTQNGERLKIAVNGSIAPTIYEYLTDEAVEVGENGWGFKSHMQEVITK